MEPGTRILVVLARPEYETYKNHNYLNSYNSLDCIPVPGWRQTANVAIQGA